MPLTRRPGTTEAPDISSSAAQRLTRRLMFPTAEERAEEIVAEREWRQSMLAEAYEFRMAGHANLVTAAPSMNFKCVLDDPAPVIELPPGRIWWERLLEDEAA